MSFDGLALEVCHKHLSNTSAYYLPNRFWEAAWDDGAPGGGVSFVTNQLDTFTPYFDGECLSNIEAIICHASFRECREVGDGWLPSAMCRSECERRNAIWDRCLERLGSDSERLAAFQAASGEVVHYCKLHGLPNHSDS